MRCFKKLDGKRRQLRGPNLIPIHSSSERGSVFSRTTNKGSSMKETLK